jgi:two-component system, cell cycle sensor histidine kinase and response regulator CckA
MSGDFREYEHPQPGPNEDGLSCRSILKGAPVAVAVVQDGVTLFANDRFLWMFGLVDREGVIGSPFVDSLAPRARGVFRLKAGETAAGRSDANEHESVGLRGDGSEFPVMIAMSRVELAAGPGVACFFAASGERQRFEEALWQSEAFFSSIFERSPTATWLSDDQGTLLRMNQACRDLLHITDEEVVGRYNVLRDNIVEEQGLLPVVNRVFDEGETVRFELEYDSSRLEQLPLSDAARLSLDVTIYPMKDAQGRVSNAVIQHIDVTERKKAEESLRQSEARLLQAQAMAHVGNWEIDLATGAMWVSDEVFRIHGVEPGTQEVAMGQARTHILPDDQPIWDAAYEDLLGGAAGLDLELRLRRAGDGAVRVVHAAGMLIRDEAGSPSRVVGVVHDITEQREAEERLRLTQYSVDYALDPIVWVDSSGRFVWANHSACASVGYSRDELLAMTVFDIDPTLGREEWAASWEKTKQKGFFTTETLHRKKDGETFPVELSVNYVEFEGKEYNCSIARDISERKRSEARATWFSRVLDASVNEIYLYDCETLRFSLANQGAQRNLGYTMDELMQMTPVDLNPNATRAMIVDQLSPLVSGAEREVVFEVEHYRKDGSAYPAEVHVQLTEHEPRPLFLSIVLDITARKAVEEALRASEEQLRQSQKMEAIGQLAGGIAHDFNNLLTAIIGYTDLLSAGLPVDEAPHRDLQEIMRAAERASALTRQILAFSRRQAMRPTVVSLNEVLTEMEALLRRSLGEHIELVFRREPELGLVEVDTHQFEQVVLNLALNARDAMPGGGRLTLATTNVETDAGFALLYPEAKPGSFVVLSVADTGVGMDEETIAHMYEPFFTTKEIGKGTGLGLSTVYGIVHQSGGVVTVDSSPGKGSIFRVYLPRVFAASPSSVLETAPPTVQRRGNILVVEDEAAIRHLVARVLVGLGHSVTVAATAREALDIAHELEHPPDLLLTDVMLPGGMLGPELADRLRSFSPGLRVLYMSGYTRDDVMHGGRLDEGIGFVQKPFSPETIAAAVREQLDASA